MAYAREYIFRRPVFLEGETLVRFPHQEEEMRYFADRITPRNWNIYTFDKGRYIHEIPGTLNVFLTARDYAADDWWVLGWVKSPMSFIRLNGIMTAKVELWIYPHGDLHEATGLSWKGTVIHELAHVAVHRYAAYKKKLHRTEGDISSREIEEEIHGPIFQRALTTMFNRVLAAFGTETHRDDLLSEVVADLDYCDEVNSG